MVNGIGRIGEHVIWGSGDVTTSNATLRRIADVCPCRTDPFSGNDPADYFADFELTLQEIADRVEMNEIILVVVRSIDIVLGPFCTTFHYGGYRDRSLPDHRNTLAAKSRNVVIFGIRLRSIHRRQYRFNNGR